MATKLQMITEPSEKTGRTVARSPENWTKFLDTAAQNYKIYAQRPDATVCAEIGVWNKLGRWVNVGVHGITLIDDGGTRQRLRHVFDVSDTNDRCNRVVPLWQMSEADAEEVTEALENAFGEYGMLRKTFLKEHRRGMYASLMMQDRLNSHLAEIDQIARKRVERIVSQFLEKDPVPDKAANQMGWVHEQSERPGGRNRAGGADLQLKWHDRKTEDANLPFFHDTYSINAILRDSPRLNESRQQIAAFFAAHADETCYFQPICFILGINKIDCEAAGQYRKHQVFITGTEYVPPAPDQVPELMRELIIELGEKSKTLHPLRLAAFAHRRLVDIHPFTDGNGRTARLLMNLILVHDGHCIVSIPPVLRLDYIGALRTAQREKIRTMSRCPV